MIISLLLGAAPVPANTDIIVTASLVPAPATEVPAATTVFDEQQISALGEPFALDVIRLSPGVSVSTSGDQGAQTQIRIRGAEANHTLLFVDGIAFNDPAAGNEARFETLGSDGLSRIEIVRGPQSALWGSEALGAVIALETADPGSSTRASAAAEYGSHNFYRGNVSLVTGGGRGGVTATASWMGSDGIDILGGGRGDNDGFESRSASLKAVYRPSDSGEIGIVGHYIWLADHFDGVDPVTFLRADTQDASKTETAAVRAWATLGRSSEAAWSGTIEAQYLDSTNGNRNGTTPLNTSGGERLRIGGHIVHRFAVSGTRHTLVAAVEREDETFRASDVEFGGLSDQRRTRGRTAYVGEWRAEWGGLLSTDVAVRRDNFNRFAPATTFRAGAVLHVAPGLSLRGSYGEGISQPTFYDLYGFFPGSFVGNPNLQPERSRGYEAGAAFQRRHFGLAVTAFSNQLQDEIVSVFDPATFLSSTANATGTSPRRGIEASAEWRPWPGFSLGANYTYLDAQQQTVAGAVRLREVRRPRNTANAYVTWEGERLRLGASLAYVGARQDTDFDTFQTVRLNSYCLAGLRIAYPLLPNLEVFARVENALDARYQDVVGYATLGRTFYGGIRARLGR